jgi:hypothetical protein
VTVTNLDYARDRRGHRQRIAFHDRDIIRDRLQQLAASAKLRGARKAVLDAILELLCGFSRVADDQISFRQIAQRLPRPYAEKTISRALRTLCVDELIEYRAAQGRGRHATIAIHPRFTPGVELARRDESTGKVVTFSRPDSSICPKGTYLTPATPDRTVPRKRPIGVVVDRSEIDRVMADLDEHYQTLPRHLRWMLGREVCRVLARGYRPDQIRDILNAPMPAGLTRPYRLATWRLTQNFVGPGPRLAPRQRAWDAAHAEAERAVQATADQRLSDAINAVTTPADRLRMVTALQKRLRLATVDAAAAIRQAARIACREHPGLSMALAITAWLAANDTTPAAEAPTPLPDLLSHAAAGACISCGDHGGVVRVELPLKSAVCDDCWLADEAENATRDAAA